MAGLAADGLYEHIVTGAIARDLAGMGVERVVTAVALDIADSHVIEKFKGTFEGLWDDPEFEAYESGSERPRTRLHNALATTAWRLESALPAGLYGRYATLSQG